MINYFIRPGNVHVKINTSTSQVDLVLNIPTQKTFSVIMDNLEYYNNAVAQSSTWAVSDESTFESNKSIVLQELNSRV